VDINDFDIDPTGTRKKTFKLVLDKQDNKKQNIDLFCLNKELENEDKNLIKNNNINEIDINVNLNDINAVNEDFENFDDDNSFDSYQECNDIREIEDEELKNIKTTLEKVKKFPLKNMLFFKFSFNIILFIEFAKRII